MNRVGTGPQSARSRRSTPRKLDRRGPRVVSRTPDAGARGVRRNANIKVVFNEPMVAMTSQAVVLKVAGGRRIRAEVTYNAAARRMVINPRRPLRANTRYHVRLTRKIRDASGNRLTAQGWSFTTR